MEHFPSRLKTSRTLWSSRSTIGKKSSMENSTKRQKLLLMPSLKRLSTSKSRLISLLKMLTLSEVLCKHLKRSGRSNLTSSFSSNLYKTCTHSLTPKPSRVLSTRKNMTKLRSSKANGKISSLIQSKQETSFTTNKLSSRKS